MTASHRLSADQCATLARPVMTAFIAAAQDWKLDSEETREIAGNPPKPQFDVWLRALATEDPLHIASSRLLRLGAAIGIHKATGRLMPRREDRLRWLTQPSRGPACQGLAPLVILKNPEDLIVIGFREAIDKWLLLPGLAGAQVVALPDRSSKPKDLTRKSKP